MEFKKQALKKLLTKYVRNNFDLSSEETKNLVSAFELKILSHGDYFLKEGEISSTICFISEGVMRTHKFNEEGNDITQFFFKENQFLTNLESYRTGKPSKQYIQAITDCRLWVIKKRKANKLPGWEKIFQQLVQQTLLRKISNQRALRNLSAKKKYEQFLDTDSDILQRVPLKYIASYLGIAPQSLSRIRRSI